MSKIAQDGQFGRHDGHKNLVHLARRMTILGGNQDLRNTLNAPATLDDYRWLVGPAAREWLDQADANDRELVSQVAELRRQLSAARAHLVLEQATLRLRARQKFSAAEQMFF